MNNGRESHHLFPGEHPHVQAGEGSSGGASFPEVRRRAQVLAVAHVFSNFS